jgi:8-hydroxy-5-deazaflavin:NADPH oxidoreductase
MKIGIVGAGRIGGTLAQLFAAAGHEVMIANSRGPATLQDLVSSIDGDVSAGEATEAAAFGDVDVLTIPLKAVWDLPNEMFDGKILIDTNNYYPDRDGHISELDNDSKSSSQMIAEHFPTARVVKAFNAIYFEHLRDEGEPGSPSEQRTGIAVASDDDEAKRVVFDLIDEIRFTPVDSGDLRSSRHQQPGTPVYPTVIDGGMSKPGTPAEVAERLRQA